MTDTARSILLGIFLVGVGGISVDLWLLGHYEDLDQFIPHRFPACITVIWYCT